MAPVEIAMGCIAGDHCPHITCAKVRLRLSFSFSCSPTNWLFLLLCLI